MHYFTKHVDWNQAREAEVRSRPDLQTMDSDETDGPSKDGPFYFPIPSQLFSVNFKGTKIWASRHRELVGDTSWEESLRLTFLTISNKPTRDFISSAKQSYLEYERGKVLCYRPDRYTRWSRATMTKRSLVSLHLPGDTKERVLEDVGSFLSTDTQRWYADRKYQIDKSSFSRARERELNKRSSLFSLLLLSLRRHSLSSRLSFTWNSRNWENLSSSRHSF